VEEFRRVGARSGGFDQGCWCWTAQPKNAHGGSTGTAIEGINTREGGNAHFPTQGINTHVRTGGNSLPHRERIDVRRRGVVERI
jgi:hypothetical protein